MSKLTANDVRARARKLLEDIAYDDFSFDGTSSHVASHLAALADVTISLAKLSTRLTSLGVSEAVLADARKYLGQAETEYLRLEDNEYRRLTGKDR